MTLIELKQHLQTVRIATLAGLCAIFKMEPTTIQPMLDFWIKKGVLRRCQNPTNCQSACSSCLQCGIQKNDYYEWVVSV